MDIRRAVWSLCLVVALGAGAAMVRPGFAEAGSASPATIAARAIDAAEDAIKARKYDDAKEYLRVALREEPDNPVAAESLRRLHDLDGGKLDVDEKLLRETERALGPGFRREQTKHFTIVTNCAPAWSRERGRLLERAHDQFERVMRRMGLEYTPPRKKLVCVLIEDHAQYEAFATAQDGVRATWVAGYYASLANRIVFYNDETGPGFRAAHEQLGQAEKQIEDLESKARDARRERQTEYARRLDEQARDLKVQVRAERDRLEGEADGTSVAKTIHEAMHLLSFNCGLQTRTHQFPFWITEGFATCFETEDPKRSFGPDYKNAVRDKELREAIENDALVPLGVLVSLNSIESLSAEDAEVMYAQSYGVFRYLFRTEREKLAQLFRDIQAEPNGYLSARRQAELFADRFGDIDELETRWLAWEKSGGGSRVAGVMVDP